MAEAVKMIEDALFARFGERFAVDAALPGLAELARLTARRVCRRYAARELAPDLLRLLCAAALSAPSKSDLQQADILIVRDQDRRGRIADLLPAMPWVREAPAFLVFLANGRRVPQISALRGKPFPNDHLDLFFNATVDAAIVLATFLRAAEAVGLGCCPISVIRDHARAIAELLELPEKVVPVAGMAVGWPAEEGALSPRLSLSTTVHEERFTRRRSGRAGRSLRSPARGEQALPQPARRRAFRPRGILRLVGGQGAAIRRAAACRFRRLRAGARLSSRLKFQFIPFEKS